MHCCVCFIFIVFVVIFVIFLLLIFVSCDATIKIKLSVGLFVIGLMAGSNDGFNVGKIYIIGFIVKFNDVIGLYGQMDKPSTVRFF